MWFTDNGSGAGTSDNEDENEDGNEDGNESNESGRPPKVEFNADQQAELNRLIKREAAKAATKAKADLQKQIDDQKARETGNFEKLLNEAKADNEKLAGELRQTRARTTVYDLAVKANAVTPEGVWRYIKDDIDYDDDGKPKNVGELLRALQTEAPKLFGTGNPPGGGGDGGRGGKPPAKTDFNAVLRRGMGGGERS
jgi:hypothetical protein